MCGKWLNSNLSPLLESSKWQNMNLQTLQKSVWEIGFMSSKIMHQWLIKADLDVIGH